MARKEFGLFDEKGNLVNRFFNEDNGSFLEDMTVEKFFKTRIDFSILFDYLGTLRIPLVSDVTKCYFAFQSGKTYEERVKYYYEV